MKQEARVYRTACPLDCPDTCSILATVEDGRVTRLDGDPDHPFTRGFLCHKVAHYDRRLYSPLRMLYPARRVGAKGEGKFARITWDEALDEIASRFRPSRPSTAARPSCPTPMAAPSASCSACPDIASSTAWAQPPAAHYLRPCRHGRLGDDDRQGHFSTDLAQAEHSDFIVIWGMNIAATNVHFVPIVKAAKKRGARVVQIDPYRNRTSHLADDVLQLRPGHGRGACTRRDARARCARTSSITIISQHYTLGYEALRERVLTDYPVDRVARITGARRRRRSYGSARGYGRARAPFLRVGFALPGTRTAAWPCALSPACLAWWGHFASRAAALITKRPTPSRSTTPG